MSTLVFVFGTLKEGFPNWTANNGVRLPGDYVTTSSYPFYLVGERHSPWLFNAPGRGNQVLGQVFEVSTKSLQRMDALERVDEPDGYERVLIQVNLQSSEKQGPITVNAYLKNEKHLQDAEIKIGPLAVYTHEHASLYRSRSSRIEMTQGENAGFLAEALRPKY